MTRHHTSVHLCKSPARFGAVVPPVGRGQARLPPDHIRAHAAEPGVVIMLEHAAAEVRVRCIAAVTTRRSEPLAHAQPGNSRFPFPAGPAGAGSLGASLPAA